MKWHVLTFGGGSWEYRRSTKRLIREVEKFQMFESKFIENDKSLFANYPEFATKHQKILNFRNPGFGFWVWKPFLILEYLRKIEPGDGLLYLDSGCSMNFCVTSKKRLTQYFDLTLKSGSLLFKADNKNTQNELSEKKWSKKILTSYLNLTEAQLESSQTLGGIIFFIANEKNIKFVSEWLSLCEHNEYEFLLPDRLEMDKTTVKHRNDQSILSCIYKQHNLFSIWNETHFSPNWGLLGRDFPIWANRNRTGISSFQVSIFDIPDRFVRTFRILKIKIGILVGRSPRHFYNRKFKA